MQRRNRILILLCGVMFLTFMQKGSAQTTYTWTQNSAGTQLWNNASNWSGGVVPDPVAGDTISKTLAPTEGSPIYVDLGADRTFENISVAYGGFANKDFVFLDGNTITLEGSDPTADVDDKAVVIIQSVLAGTNGLKKTGTATLSLENASNTFSGGIELAGGVLTVVSEGCFGDPSNAINVSGDASLSLPSGTYARSISIGDGVTLGYSDKNTITITGAITGLGGLEFSSSGFGGQNITLSSTSNTFAGRIKLGRGDTGAILTANSFSDSTNDIEMVIGSKGTTQFTWGSGATDSLVLNERQFVLSGSVVKNDHVIENANTNPANIVVINKDILIPSTADRALVLQGVNTGDNTIAGVIPDSTNSVTSLNKAQAGTWVLAGHNTYSGDTTISGGVLALDGSTCIPDSSTLTIDGGKLQLNAGVKERVDSLVLGSTTQTNITSYGSESSSAAIRSDTYFSGTGLLFLGMDPPPQGTVIIVK